MGVFDWMEAQTEPKREIPMDFEFLKERIQNVFESREIHGWEDAKEMLVKEKGWLKVDADKEIDKWMDTTLDQWLLIDMNNEEKMPPAWDEYLEEIPPVWCKSSKPKEVGSNSRLKTSGLEWNDQTNNAINVYSVTHSGQEREEHKEVMTSDKTEYTPH